MRLNLKDIIHVPGAVRPFSFEMDMSQMDFNGQRPIEQPVAVSGQVRNMAGALMLEGTAATKLHLNCDRCAKPFWREKAVHVSSLLATELADESNDSEIILLDDGEVDLDEVMTTAFVLEMDSKNLCAEDCKGICAGCGADLNTGTCQCKPEVDPRLAKLAQLLEEKTRE